MKLIYFVQEKTVDSNCGIVGTFYDVKNALQCAFTKIKEAVPKQLCFNIVECPINKTIKGGITVYHVETMGDDISKVLEINPVYTFGGIKKWVNDQKKAAKRS